MTLRINDQGRDKQNQFFIEKWRKSEFVKIASCAG